MEPLEIARTSDSPYVRFDAEAEIFEIKGWLIPEDPQKFFQPVIEWSKEYIKNPNPKTEIDLNIEYINTSSSKSLMHILRVYERLNQIDNNVKINWYFSEEDMLEAAHDYMSVVKIPFEIRKVKHN